MEWSWLVRTHTHRALERFSTGATPIIKTTTWPSCVAECWLSWWRRCRRWRWTRPSWAASGLTIQWLRFQLLRQDLVNISTASGPSSFSTLMSRGSKRFQGTRYMHLFCLFILTYHHFTSTKYPRCLCCIFTSLMTGWSSLESECTPALRSTPGEHHLHLFSLTMQNMQKWWRSTPGELFCLQTHHNHLLPSTCEIWE